MSGIRGVIRHGNLSVPYVAAWSSEAEPEIRREPLLGGRPALFRSGGRGDGTPLFGRMDEARCRQVVLRRPCQVCARPLDDGWVIDDDRSAHAARPILREPPSCSHCFVLALQSCPGLRRTLAAPPPRLIVARVARYSPVVSLLRPVEGGDPALNALLADWTGYPPAGTCSVQLERYDLLPMAYVRRLAEGADV